MARTYKEAIQRLEKVSVTGQSNFGNVFTGGQLGFGHNLRFLDAATPLVLPNAVPVILHTPTIFDNIPDAARIFKSLVERHTKTIDGINYAPTLESQEGMMFKDGQALEMPTKATVSQPSPTMTFPELPGNIVYEFFRTWSSLIINPNTQFSSMSSFTGSDNGGEYYANVVSSYAASLLMIQYDMTLLPQNIIGAALVMNMWPKEIGEQVFKKDISSGAEVPERSINFAGFVVNDASTRALGITVANILKLHQANYNFAPAPVDEDYQTSLELDAGNKQLMDNILSDFTDPYA